MEQGERQSQSPNRCRESAQLYRWSGMTRSQRDIERVELIRHATEHTGPRLQIAPQKKPRRRRLQRRRGNVAPAFGTLSWINRVTALRAESRRRAGRYGHARILPRLFAEALCIHAAPPNKHRRAESEQCDRRRLRNWRTRHAVKRTIRSRVDNLGEREVRYAAGRAPARINAEVHTVRRRDVKVHPRRVRRIDLRQNPLRRRDISVASRQRKSRAA